MEALIKQPMVESKVLLRLHTLNGSGETTERLRRTFLEVA